VCLGGDKGVNARLTVKRWREGTRVSGEDSIVVLSSSSRHEEEAAGLSAPKHRIGQSSGSEGVDRNKGVVPPAPANFKAPD
jgi:hypothetical protein